MHQQHVLARRHQADRRKIGARVIADIGVDRRIDGERAGGDQQRVAVRGRADDLAGRDGAAGAAAILDHHRLAQGGAHFLGDHAGDQVVAAARRVRHHESDRPRREIVRERRSRERDSDAGAEKHPDESVDRRGGLPHGSGRALPGTGASKAFSITATMV